jgi:peptidyl-prolyl cis-trans isomerase C
MPMTTRHASWRAGLPIAVLAAVLPLAVLAQSSADDPVLVENSAISIRKSDYEAELERLPPDLRPGFANNERRVNDLLRRMLLERTLAAQARAEKLDQVPRNATRLAAEVDKLYAQLKVAQIEEAAAADFDANRATFEARARELYTVDRKKYQTPEQLQASHILFETKTRSRDEAKKLADEARAKVAAGTDFNRLAREVSEDRSAKANMGRLDWFTRAEMDPAFAEAAFALKNVGDVSAPVLSSFGWHVIRLDGRRPAVQRSYEEVRDAILGELKQKRVNEAREAAIAQLRADPTIRANREAIDALVIRVDPEAARRAMQQTTPGAAPAPR